MKKLALALGILIAGPAGLAGCDAYHRHPAATVAASVGLVAGPSGLVIGCGFVHGGMPDWQDTAEHRYGIAYVGLGVTVLAAAAFAALYPEGVGQ